jgi:hypothetical protein
VTTAGVSVASLAAILTLVGLTGGCGGPTDTTHYDHPRVVDPPKPPPVLHVGDTATWVAR